MRHQLLFVVIFVPLWCLMTFTTRVCADEFISGETIDRTIEALIKEKGQGEAQRIRKGVTQVSKLWREEDGSKDDFFTFCGTQFIPEGKELQECFDRNQSNLLDLYSHYSAIDRELTRPIEVESGSMLPCDSLFAQYVPSSHMLDDLFRSKVAFGILLNFPLCTPEEKIHEGPRWTREQWARVALADGFDHRIPAQVLQNLAKADREGGNYLDNYHIYLKDLMNSRAKHPFSGETRAVRLWGLKDEIRTLYGQKDGLEKQEMIARVMERIIQQQIPAVVVNNDKVSWDPGANVVVTEGKTVTVNPQGGMRYEHLRNVFKVASSLEPYFPGAGTFIDIAFDEFWQAPEKAVEQQLLSVVSSPVAKEAARLIQKRLGRKLKPFDIWYDGFRGIQGYSESTLDKIVSQRYPDLKSLQKDIPRLLKALGASEETAALIGEKIVLEPARYAPHVLNAVTAGDRVHIRVKIGPKGMTFGEFYYALHQIGKGVQNVLSLNHIDYPILQGLPNNAFSEAFAFIMQSQVLELLGLRANPMNGCYLAIDSYWTAYTRSGEALLSLKVWRWLQDHRSATSEEIEEAVSLLARELWNQYYAPVIGEKDSILLAMYAHFYDEDWFLPSRSIGRMIEYQIAAHVRESGLRTEMVRLCTLGSIPPDLWMNYAVGSPVSSRALLEAAAMSIIKVDK